MTAGRLLKASCKEIKSKLKEPEQQVKVTSGSTSE